MPNLILDLSHDQTRLVVCAMSNSRTEIDKLVNNQRFSNQYKIERILFLWGYIDADLTVLASPQFRVSRSAANTTELNLTTRDYNNRIGRLVQARDKWLRLAKNGALASDYLLERFVEDLWAMFTSNFDDFFAALPAGAKPTGNETSKP